MCGLPMASMGYRRVTRQYMRLKRVHDYAANRFMDAHSVGAAKFWRATMKACVYRRKEWVHRSEIEARQ